MLNATVYVDVDNHCFSREIGIPFVPHVGMRLCFYFDDSDEEFIVTDCSWFVCAMNLVINAELVFGGEDKYERMVRNGWEVS